MCIVPPLLYSNTLLIHSTSHTVLRTVAYLVQLMNNECLKPLLISIASGILASRFYSDFCEMKVQFSVIYSWFWGSLLCCTELDSEGNCLCYVKLDNVCTLSHISCDQGGSSWSLVNRRDHEWSMVITSDPSYTTDDHAWWQPFSSSASCMIISERRTFENKGNQTVSIRKTDISFCRQLFPPFSAFPYFYVLNSWQKVVKVEKAMTPILLLPFSVV